MARKNKEDLEVYDFDARDYIPEDATIDSIDEEINTEEVLESPTTHDVEEAIPGTLEEV